MSEEPKAYATVVKVGVNPNPKCTAPIPASIQKLKDEKSIRKLSRLQIKESKESRNTFEDVQATTQSTSPRAGKTMTLGELIAMRERPAQAPIIRRESVVEYEEDADDDVGTPLIVPRRVAIIEKVDEDDSEPVGRKAMFGALKRLGGMRPK